MRLGVGKSFLVGFQRPLTDKHFTEYMSILYGNIMCIFRIQYQHSVQELNAQMHSLQETFFSSIFFPTKTKR